MDLSGLLAVGSIGIGLFFDVFGGHSATDGDHAAFDDAELSTEVEPLLADYQFPWDGVIVDHPPVDIETAILPWGEPDIDDLLFEEVA